MSLDELDGWRVYFILKNEEHEASKKKKGPLKQPKKSVFGGRVGAKRD
jgi:hypothetical protein